MFALGVLLFILHTGREPFEQASQTDPLYNLIMNNKFDVFWGVHESATPNEQSPLSPEFRDLMQNMLAFQPYQRLSMVDLMAHPFFQQEGGAATMATRAQVKTEMLARKLRAENMQLSQLQ